MGKKRLSFINLIHRSCDFVVLRFNKAAHRSRNFTVSGPPHTDVWDPAPSWAAHNLVYFELVCAYVRESCLYHYSSCSVPSRMLKATSGRLNTHTLLSQVTSMNRSCTIQSSVSLLKWRSFIKTLPCCASVPPMLLGFLCRLRLSFSLSMSSWSITWPLLPSSTCLAESTEVSPGIIRGQKGFLKPAGLSVSVWSG